jgi:uncharacterized protein (DUF736 family)
MSQIGHFTSSPSGFDGRLRTLTLDVSLVLVPATASDAENAPDYRVHLDTEDGPEVGAGWKRSSEKAGHFVSLLLDDPAFSQPMRANLFQSPNDKTLWTLHWNRPSKRDDRG